MPAYMIVDVEVHDAEAYAEYVRQVPPIIRRFGGRYLVRGGQVTRLAGDWNPGRMILIEFPDVEALRACLASDAYRRIAPLRERSTTSRAVVVESDPPDDPPADL